MKFKFIYILLLFTVMYFVFYAIYADNIYFIAGCFGVVYCYLEDIDNKLENKK